MCVVASNPQARQASHLCIIQQNTKMGSRKMICATLMAVKLPFSARMPSQLTGSCSSPAAAQRRSSHPLYRFYFVQTEQPHLAHAGCRCKQAAAIPRVEEMVGKFAPMSPLKVLSMATILPKFLKPNSTPKMVK